MTRKIDLLTTESLVELASIRQPLCLSLYQPTHRRHPENQQDPVRFRNLVKVLEASLRRQYPAVEARPLLEPFRTLASEQDFWNHALDGLAVMGGSDLFRVFRLQRPVAELAVVADSFHTKPLRRFLQSGDRYHVLGLSLRKVRFFAGSRDMLDEIDPVPGFPRTMTEAPGDEHPEPHSTVSSHGGVGQGSTPMHHGHGGKKDMAQVAMERFWRAVDRAVLEHYSRPSGLPLILAALPEHHHPFRQVSHNPFLMKEGLRGNPDEMSVDELRTRVWQVVEPQYRARLAALAAEYAESRARELGSDDLAQVARAAAEGRVATLLIEADRQEAGRLDDTTGRVEFADLRDPEVDDLLDDLGELVSKMGGRVIIVPAGQMPVRTGLAASYRY